MKRKRNTIYYLFQRFNEMIIFYSLFTVEFLFKAAKSLDFHNCDDWTVFDSSCLQNHWNAKSNVSKVTERNKARIRLPNKSSPVSFSSHSVSSFLSLIMWMDMVSRVNDRGENVWRLCWMAKYDYELLKKAKTFSF